MKRYAAVGWLALAVCSTLEAKEGGYGEWSTGRAKELREYIAEHPKDAAGYYALGYAACHVKDLETVRKSYQKAIELDPGNEWYKISYGWALFNAEAYRSALKQWRKAYDFCHGNHKENNITVALGYYGVGDFEKAAGFYAKQVAWDERYGNFKGLEEATARWTWPEKEAVYRLYDIWRYSYGRKE